MAANIEHGILRQLIEKTSSYIIILSVSVCKNIGKVVLLNLKCYYILEIIRPKSMLCEVIFCLILKLKLIMVEKNVNLQNGLNWL